MELFSERQTRALASDNIWPLNPAQELGPQPSDSEVQPPANEESMPASPRRSHAFVPPTPKNAALPKAIAVSIALGSATGATAVPMPLAAGGPSQSVAFAAGLLAYAHHFVWLETVAELARELVHMATDISQEVVMTFEVVSHELRGFAAHCFWLSKVLVVVMAIRVAVSLLFGK